jgi:hypothetical protein
MGPVLWPVLTAIPAPYRWAIDEIVPQPAPLADDDSGFRQTIPWPPSPLLGPQYHQDEVEILPADDDAGYRPVLPNAAPVPGLVWASDDLPVTPATPIDDDARWFPAPMQADPAGSAVWMVDASEVSPGQATGAIADDETGGAPWLLFEPSAWTTILAPWTFDQGESFTPAVTEDYWQIPAQIAQVRFSQPLLGDEEIVPQPPPAVAHEAYWQNPVAPVIWTPPAILLQPWRHDNQELVAPALPNEAYWINSVAPVIWKPAPVLLQPWRDDSQDAVTAAPTAPPNEEHWTSGVAPTVWTPPGRLLQPWQWDNQEIPTPPPAFVDDDAGWFQHVQSVAVLPLIPWADSAEPAFPPAVPEDTAGPAWLLVPVSTWTTILAPWTFDQGESSGEAIASVVCRLRERGLPDFTLTEQGRPAFRVRDASREAFSLTDRSRP